MAGASNALRSAHPVKRTRSVPRLREASFRDYEQIAALESRYRLDVKSFREWSHLWLGNPAYHDLQSDWPIGWVVENGDGRIVGSIGNIPLWCEFQGRRILAASGRAQVAEPEYRSATLLLLDRLIHQPGVDLYVNNTMSRNAAASFSAFGCPRVPVGLWDQAAFWITHHPGFVQSFLKMKRWPLAKPLSYPFAAAAFLKDCLTPAAFLGDDAEVTSCQGFDDRFGDFWADLKRDNPRLLLAVRTREVLEWHFQHALRNKQLWIATVVDGARLTAYAIFDRKHSPRSGLQRARLVDFQSRDGSAALLSPILAWALRKCREEGIHMLEVVGRWLEKGEVIDAAAPYRRSLGAWAYFYRANHPELAESLKDPAAWAPSLFDGDASL